MPEIALILREPGQPADSFRTVLALPHKRLKRPQRVTRDVPVRCHGADERSARDFAKALSARECVRNRKPDISTC